MALLIDSDVVSQADLLAIDPEIQTVANAENINLSGANSIIRRSWNESANELLNRLQAFGGDIIAWPGSITTYGAFGIARPRLRLNQIVVSSVYGGGFTSPLADWLAYRALTLFYRACANRRDKDRYETKWNRFQGEAADKWRTLAANGIPMVAIPLAAPGALHDYYAGAWSAANLSTVAGGANALTAYTVAITWVDQTSGYVNPLNKNNSESGPSDVLTIIVPANQQLKVSIAGLNPPSASGQQPPRGIAEGPYVTRTATGWNVYVGLVNDPNGTLYLQNATPIPIGTTSYTVTGATTYQLLPGQVPDSNYTFQNMLQRG